MSSLRNAVYRRAHKERSQPEARKKFGILEKHKDYIDRAKAFHQKEQALREKAAFRNPDEFYFKMAKTKSVNGVHRPESEANKYTQEELMLMKTQDLGYILQKLQTEKKKIEKLTATLHSLGNQPSSRHVYYAEDREDAEMLRLETSMAGEVPAPKVLPGTIKREDAEMLRLETSMAGEVPAPKVLPGTIKREDAEMLRLETSMAGEVPAPKVLPGTIKRKTAASYKELEARKSRVKELEKVYMDMTMQKELQKKGKKRKLGEDDIVCPTSTPVYKWRPERKR